MSYIPLEDHLPGITGLLEFNTKTAAPIRVLTQILMRGQSTLTEGERELIATYVSSRNQCQFCTNAHAAAAELLLEDSQICQLLTLDFENAPLSSKMKALLQIAGMVQLNGKEVTPEIIQKAKQEGATELEIHDTVLIAALFCMYNRYVDGLATQTPVQSDFYKGLAKRIVQNGYNRMPGGYDHLKKSKS